MLKWTTLLDLLHGAGITVAVSSLAILAGVPLRQFDRTLKDSLLVAVTEQRTREEIDAFADALGRAVA